jgi:hypothetical protein
MNRQHARVFAHLYLYQGKRFCSPYLFGRGKRARVDAIALLVKLESRNDERRESAPEPLHDLGRLEHA